MKPSLSHLLILSTSFVCISPLVADINSSMLVEEKESQLDFQTDNRTDTLGSTHIEDKGVDYTQGHISAETTSTMPREGKKPNPECRKANSPHRLEFKHIEAKGIGYNQGYTSFDAFFTGAAGSYVPFLDVRAHVFNNGKWAFNTGIGTRYILDPCHTMVGANIYYDYRRADHNTNLSQVGAGLEAFYNRFEARINGYLPFGQKRKRIETHLDAISFKGFSGNYILINEYYNNTYQGAMKGINAEVGAHLCGNRKQYDLYLGVGPYYYDVSDGKHSWGGKVRLKGEVTKYLFLEISDSYDSIFHNRFQGSVNLSIPFGRRYCYPNKMKTSCENVMDWQAVLPVERQEIIVVSKFKKKRTIDPVAIDPTTGQPFYVVFVNNTNASLGNGTFENPYQNLTTNDNATSAQSGSSAGNTIYVFAGDNSAAHMAGGNMVLLTSQRLLGSSNSHQYQTTKGLLTIPALTIGMPMIQGVTGGSGNNAVVLANNNEVSGFNISFNSNTPVNTGKACIIGNGVIINANINNNVLSNETIGLQIGGSTINTCAAGTISVNNNISSTHLLTTNAPQCYAINASNANITFENNLATTAAPTSFGLSLTSFGNVAVSMQNNDFEGIQGYSYFIANNVTGTLPSSYNIQNNFVSNTQTGFLINNTCSAGATIIHDNNTISNAATTSAISSSTGTVCVRFNGNTGYPNSPGSGYQLNRIGGTFNLEPLLNNYPNPALAGNFVSVPACTCAPCP